MALLQKLPPDGFHGTADRLNPVAGAGAERWNESVPDAAAAWARGGELGAGF